MFCPRCGVEIPDSRTGCPRCATNMSAGGSVSNDKLYVLFAHLGGVFSFIPSLVIYFLVRDRSDNDYVIGNAREALNFQITVLLIYGVCYSLTSVLIGLWLLPLVYTANIVFCLVAAIRAYPGEIYRYPLSIRLISK